MNLRNRSSIGTAWALAAVLMLSVAGTAEAEEEAGSMVSGFLSLDANTNFMSYGFDVWGAGTFDDLIFNPSFGLEFDLGNLVEGLSANIGTWWDVNDNLTAATSPIGNSINEVDVWAGLAYTKSKFSVSLTWQEWMYGGDSERILDVGLGYDTFLSPSLTIHGRVDDGPAVEEGVIIVLGGEYGFDLGPVGIGLPAGVAFSGAEDFYFDGGDAGFAYVNVGVQAGVPLSFLGTAHGDWAFNAGGTFYYTNEDVIGNADDAIFAANFGVSVGF